jgi:hypothetical protein
MVHGEYINLGTSSTGEHYMCPIRTARALLELTTVEPYQ